MSGKLTVTIPETLIKYFGDNAWKSAVNSLLDHSPKKYPPNLKWEDQIDFHSVYVAAQVTRLDYHKFVYDLWDKCWDNLSRIKSICGSGQKWDDVKYLAPYDVWDEGLYRECSVKESAKRYVQLFVDIEENYLTAGLYVSANREKDQVDDSIRKSVENAIARETEISNDYVMWKHAEKPIVFDPNKSVIEVDISDLKTSCDDALNALK